MTMALHTQEIKVKSRRFSVTVHADYHYDTPWENCSMLDNCFDGKYHRRDKYPSEMIVCQAGPNGKVFYDFANAVAHARKSGLTGEQADQEARKEFEWIRRWYNDQWFYVSVDAIDLSTSEIAASISGCEYDYSDESLESILNDYIIPGCETYVDKIIRNFRPDFYFTETA